ncbi:MAG: hypothetical protein ACRD2O_06335 [Terriglobia bacterium]
MGCATRLRDADMKDDASATRDLGSGRPPSPSTPPCLRVPYTAGATDGSVDWIRMVGRVDVSFVNEQRLKEKKKLLALPANLKAAGSFKYNGVPWFGEYPEVHSADSIPITVIGK